MDFSTLINALLVGAPGIACGCLLGYVWAHVQFNKQLEAVKQMSKLEAGAKDETIMALRGVIQGFADEGLA